MQKKELAQSNGKKNAFESWTKEMTRMLDENREYLVRIYESTEKARKYILWGRIMTVVYLILIIAPIVLAFIYLPSYFNQILVPYKELLEIQEPATEKIDQYLDILKNLNL